MFVVNVVCCQVEGSATSWLLVRRSPTDGGVSSCVIYNPREIGGPGPLGGGGGCRAKTKTMGQFILPVEAIHFILDFSSSACTVSISFTKHSTTECSFLQCN
jgi:hypothetical protein